MLNIHIYNFYRTAFTLHAIIHRHDLTSGAEKNYSGLIADPKVKLSKLSGR